MVPQDRQSALVHLTTLPNVSVNVKAVTFSGSKGAKNTISPLELVMFYPFTPFSLVSDRNSDFCQKCSIGALR